MLSHSSFFFFIILTSSISHAKPIFAETEIVDPRSQLGKRSEKTSSYNSLEVLRHLGVSTGTSQKLRINQPATIRGARSEHLGVFVDGVELNDTATIGGSGDISLMTGYEGEIRLSLLPQTVRLGENAFSGAIELDPQFSEQSRVDLESDSLGLFGIGASYNKKSSNTRIQASQTPGQSLAENPIAPSEKDSAKQISGYSLLEFDKGSLLISFKDAQSDEDANSFDDDVNAESKTQSLIASGLWKFTDFSKLILTVQKVDRNFSDLKDSPSDFEIDSKFESEIFKLQFQEKRLDLFEDVDFWWEASMKHQMAEFSNDRFSKNDFELAVEPHWNISDSTWLEIGARWSDSSRGEDRRQSRLQLGYKNVGLDFSSSERAPSFYQKFSTYGNPTLKLEKQVTVGFMAQLPFDLSLLIYESRFENLVDFEVIYISFDQARNRGLDLSFDHEFITVRGSYVEVWDVAGNKRLMQFPLWKLETLRKLKISEKQNLEISLSANGASIQNGNDVAASKSIDLNYLNETSWGEWNLGIFNLFNESRTLRSGYLEPGLMLRLGLGFDI